MSYTGTTIGAHTITAAYAGDAVHLGNGPTGTETTLSVIFDFTGFFQPIDNLPVLNRVKAGQSIPIKFSLGGYQGMSIFMAGYPKSGVIACIGGAVDDIEVIDAPGASGLTYDTATDQYHYVWKTEKTWGGTCRQLNVKLTDGTEHIAIFNFQK